MERKPKGYWNYEHCYEAAKECETTSEFDKIYRQAYKTSLKNGWIKDYTWFKRRCAPNKKWNRNTCFEEAKNYCSRVEFLKGSAGAYRVALKNGWLDDYTWFERKCMPVGYWTYERCYNEAKKYTFINDFLSQSSVAYSAAHKNGWYKDYVWLKPSPNRKPNGYWNKETCFEEAKKYNTRSEFEKCSASAYNVSNKNGWLDDYTWFEKGRVSDKNVYVVYCYRDDDNNCVYVGLTNNLKNRHKQHSKGFIKRGKLRFDVVYEHFISLGKEIPEPTILKDCLYVEEAKYYESYYAERFREEGMNVLNIAKTGSVGAFGKWTKEKCYEEALKYKTKKDLRLHAGAVYNVARVNGWLKDYTWLENGKFENGYWNNYDVCFEKASECKSRHEFAKKYGAAYYWARVNNWIGDYTWFTSIVKWTYDTCYEEAVKATSKSDFKRNCSVAYRVARQHGWLKDYTWFSNSKKPNGYWNYERCYEAAKQCKTNKEFRDRFCAACSTAYQKGWYKDYSWFNNAKVE